MKRRRDRTMREIIEDEDTDRAIRERFHMERHPEQSVDGDDRWARDPFDDPEAE